MSRVDGNDVVLGKTVEIINGVKVQELPIVDIAQPEVMEKTESESLRDYFKK